MGKNRLIALALLGGFVMMGIEIRFMHQYILQAKPLAWIPIYYAALASVACLLALGSNKKLRKACSFIFAVGILVGAFGFYQHAQRDPGLVMQMVNLAFTGSDAPDNGLPPMLAPLGIAGLAFVGMVSAWPTKGE